MKSVSSTTWSREELLHHHLPSNTHPSSWFHTLGHWTRLFLRALRLAAAAFPSLLLMPMALFDRTRPLYLKVVRWSVAKMGPVASKGAQWLASRPDIFPRSLCNVLATFQHDAATHAIGHTLAAVREAPGSLSERLAFVEWTPIGSGCVAQVHRGLYRVTADQDPIPVAVKVLHPGVRANVEHDLDLAMRLARFITWIWPRAYYLDLIGMVEEFRCNMMDQLEMEREARNLERFGREFARDPDIVFPKVYYGCADVLVMSLEKGTHLTEVLQVGTYPDKKKLASLGMRLFFQMVFSNNFVHGDLHAGNMLVSPSGKLIVLDAGLVLELPARQQRNLFELIVALAVGDGRQGARLMLENSVGSQCEDPAGFQAEMDSIFQRVAKKKRFATAPLGDAFIEVLQSVQRHHVRLDSKYCSLITSAIVLEGVGRALDPNMNLFHYDVRMFYKGKT